MSDLPFLPAPDSEQQPVPVIPPSEPSQAQPAEVTLPAAAAGPGAEIAIGPAPAMPAYPSEWRKEREAAAETEAAKRQTRGGDEFDVWSAIWGVMRETAVLSAGICAWLWLSLRAWRGHRHRASVLGEVGRRAQDIGAGPEGLRAEVTRAEEALQAADGSFASWRLTRRRNHWLETLGTTIANEGNVPPELAVLVQDALRIRRDSENRATALREETGRLQARGSGAWARLILGYLLLFATYKIVSFAAGYFGSTASPSEKPTNPPAASSSAQERAAPARSEPLPSREPRTEREGGSAPAQPGEDAGRPDQQPGRD